MNCGDCSYSYAICLVGHLVATRLEHRVRRCRTASVEVGGCTRHRDLVWVAISIAGWGVASSLFTWCGELDIGASASSLDVSLPGHQPQLCRHPLGLLLLVRRRSYCRSCNGCWVDFL